MNARFLHLQARQRCLCGQVLAGQFAAVEAVHATRLRLTLSPADRQSPAPGKRVFEVRIDSLLSGAEWKCTSYLFHTQSMLGCLLVLRAGSFSHNRRGKECKEDVAALAGGRWVKPMDEEYPGISWHHSTNAPIDAHACRDWVQLDQQSAPDSMREQQLPWP